MTSTALLPLLGAVVLVSLGGFLILVPRVRRQRIARRLGGFLVLAGVLSAGAALIRIRQAQVDAAPTPTARPTAVRVFHPRLGSLAETRSYLGRVLAWESADLASQMSGSVLEVPVREGDPVRRGQLLVTIDDAELAAALEAVNAQLREAEARRAAQAALTEAASRTADFWTKEVQRDLRLLQAGAISQSAADATVERQAAAEAGLKAAQQTQGALDAALQAVGRRRQELEARLRYTRLTAPFPGLVSRRLVDPGDFASSGQVLISVQNHSRLRIAFDIPQEEQSLIKVGSAIHLPDRGVSLQVDRLYPVLNPDRTRTAEADTTPGSIPPPGSFVTVQVDLKKHEGTLVSEDALFRTSDGSWAVFSVLEGRIRTQKVRRLGTREGIAVVDGVPVGVPVVLNTYLGWNRLHEGEIVEVLP